MTKPKILVLDIECPDLYANHGFIFCYGYKWVGCGKTTVVSVMDYPEFTKDTTRDKMLVRDLVKLIESADAIVTWYGNRFDLPFIRTRALLNRVKLPSEPASIDLWWTCRYKLKFTSNRLDTVHSAFEYLTKKKSPRKTKIDPMVWLKAVTGDRKSLKEIIHHCKIDIDVTENMYNKLKCAVKNHPKMNNDTHIQFCPTCHSSNLRFKGYHFTLQTQKKRWKCKDCGFSFTAAKSRRVGA